MKTYEGADGLKTGYTEEAGYCLTATAKKNKMRLIGTIMGSSDSKIRNSNMMTLLDYGFNTYEMQIEIPKGDIVSKQIITKAKKEEVNIITKKEASVLKKRGSEDKNLNYDMELNKLKLPIKKGDNVGKLILKDGNKVINKIDLTVDSSIEKANILELYKRSLKSIVSGNI